MAMQTPPPPAQGMKPYDYYNTLVSQGMRPWDAYQAVQANFGPPKSPEQQARDQAAADQRAGIGQAAGTVAGAVGMGEALAGFPNVRGAFGSGNNFAESGRLGITRNVPAETLDLDVIGNATPTVATPRVIKVEGNVATVELPNGQVDTLPTEALNDSTFMGSVNWDALGSGAMAGLSAYQAYQSYKSGDYLGAGISGASAVSLGAQAAGQAGASFAGSQSMASAAPYLGAAAGLYQGYQTGQMIADSAAGSQRTKQGALGGAASGAMIGGSIAGPVGLVIGTAVGALAGATASWTGSKKGKAQVMRDNIRGVLQQGGILDQDFKGTLADGSTYDFGKDGSTLKWKEIDKLAEKQPSAWNAAVPLTDALATAYGFVGQKASDISVWYAKGAVSNAGDDPTTAIKNAQHFAQQQGITFDQIKTKLDEAMADNRISQGQYDYYLGGARQLTANMPKPQTEGISTRPPAPLPPGSGGQIPVPEQAKKQSLRDLLNQRMNK